MIEIDDFDDILGELVGYADDNDMAALNRFNMSVNKRNSVGSNTSSLSQHSSDDNAYYPLGHMNKKGKAASSAGPTDSTLLDPVNDGVDPQRKKRRLLKKAPDAPRRFKSAYILFVMDKMDEVKKSSPEDVKITDTMKKLASMWRDLCPEQRAEYETFAKNDKDRYFEEMKTYSGPTHVPNKRKRKPPGAPKRAMSAFLAFSQQMRPLVRAENPDMKNTELSSLLAQKWRESSDETKKPFMDREIMERENYHEAMSKWKEEESNSLLLEGHALIDGSLFNDKSRTVSKSNSDPSLASLDTSFADITGLQKTTVKQKATKKMKEPSSNPEGKKRKYSRKNAVIDFDNFDTTYDETKSNSASSGINAYNRYGALDGGNDYYSLTTDVWSSISQEFWDPSLDTEKTTTSRPRPGKTINSHSIEQPYRGPLTGLHSDAQSGNISATSSSQQQHNLHGRSSNTSRASVLEIIRKKAADGGSSTLSYFESGGAPLPDGYLQGVAASHGNGWSFDSSGSTSAKDSQPSLDAYIARSHAASNSSDPAHRRVTDTLRAVHLASLQNRTDSTAAQRICIEKARADSLAAQEQLQQSMAELANAYYFPTIHK